MPNALYICYFGIREPLVQTQVLPYLRELTKMDGLRMSLVTFEPKKEVAELRSAKVAELKNELAGQGIEWHWLKYHKRLSVVATAWDILCGTLFTWRFIRRQKLDLIHARVHVPMLMAALARKFSRRKPKILFDIRGFFPEEYTDAGIWPEGGWLYRTAKRIEKWLLREADGFVILTEKGRRMIFRDELRPVEVIPCCVDFARRFPSGGASRSDEMREKLGVTGRTVYVHAGALGGLYLTRELADFMAAAKENDPGSFALFLTQSDPSEIVNLLTQRGFSEKDLFAGRVAPADVPLYLSAANVGLSFVKATYSTQSRSPTKIPEYLAAGLPIVANPGVGDVDRLIEGQRVGVLLHAFSKEGYLKALGEIGKLGDVSRRCREVAAEEFDLHRVGGARYRRLYSAVLSTAQDE